MFPNRVVAVLLAVCGFAAAVLPVAANLDWTSTAGVLGGLGAVAAAAVTWLLGWQKWEARQQPPAAPAAPELVAAQPTTRKPAAAKKPRSRAKAKPNADIPAQP